MEKSVHGFIDKTRQAIDLMQVTWNGMYRIAARNHDHARRVRSMHGIDLNALPHQLIY